jgi:hypothetical protein
MLAFCGETLTASETARGVAVPAKTPGTEEKTGESQKAGVDFKGKVFTWPNYALKAGASTDEIRRTAIRAMHDELAFQWTPETNILYTKEAGAAKGKAFSFNSGKTYAGLPYTTAGQGLLHWLQYYDFKTGVVSGITSANCASFGNSCAASVMWGWSAVASSITWSTCATLTISRGCIPVGPYQLDASITNLGDYTSDKVCAENGEDIMMQSYAAILPADALVNTRHKGDHCIMALHVDVTYKDGKIDPDKSVLHYQDQWASFTKIDGVLYEGHIEKTMTFAKLFARHYLPFTCAEFLGTKAYTVPSVTFKGDSSTVDGVLSGTLHSPYKLVTVTLTVSDKKGNEVARKKTLVVRKDIASGNALDFSLSGVDLSTTLNCRCTKGETYVLSVSALDSTATTHENIVRVEFVFSGEPK